MVRVHKGPPVGEGGSGGVAQLAERLPCTEEARGSNPLTSTGPCGPAREERLARGQGFEAPYKLNRMKARSREAPREATEGVRWMPWRQEPRKDVAGRRYATGSCQASFDPWMSEWGNLGRVTPPRPGRKPRRASGGTETSKYPEEEKSMRFPE